MPHLVMLYTPQLDAACDIDQLCRGLADAMLSVRDEAGAQVFPTGGTRVLAYRSDHHAISDGSGDHAFMYFNLRMARGRSAAVHRAVGGWPSKKASICWPRWCASRWRRCWRSTRWA